MIQYMLFEKYYDQLFLGVGSSLLVIGICYLANKVDMFKQIDFPKEVHKPDEKEIFIEKNKQLFMDSYDSQVNYNENIQKEFASKNIITQYYNPSIHVASYSAPQFVVNALQGQIDNDFKFYECAEKLV